MTNVLGYAESNGISVEYLSREREYNMRANHFHNEHEFYLMLEGERVFHFNNRPVRVKAGDFIIVNSNQTHRTTAVEDDNGYCRIILYVNRCRMEEYAQRYPGLNILDFLSAHYGVYHFSAEEAQNFLDMCLRIKVEMQNREEQYQTMIESEIIRFLIAFSRSYSDKQADSLNKSRTSSSASTVYSIADYIVKHYNETLTLDTLASSFYLSKFYLSRVFKEVMDYSINEYINIVRIKKAKQLLEETSMTILEIANEVGYGSTTYFEKIFKKYMTVTPLKYRKTRNTITFQYSENVTEEEEQ